MIPLRKEQQLTGASGVRSEAGEGGEGEVGEGEKKERSGKSEEELQLEREAAAAILKGAK